LTQSPTAPIRSSNNYAVLFFSSVQTLDAYAHCQKTCSFASLEVPSMLCTFAPRAYTKNDTSIEKCYAWKPLILTPPGGSDKPLSTAHTARSLRQ